MFVVLDGLDELSREAQIASLEIVQHLRSSKPRINVYVSSRTEELLIKETLEARKSIDLSTVQVGDDIAIFVEAAIDSGILEHNPVSRKAEMKQEIIQALVKGANGM